MGSRSVSEKAGRYDADIGGGLQDSRLPKCLLNTSLGIGVLIRNLNGRGMVSTPIY